MASVVEFGVFADRFGRAFGLEAAPRFTDRLESDLCLDSLQMLELWISIEIIAGRPIVPDALDEIRTFGQVYELYQAMVGPEDSETSWS